MKDFFKQYIPMADMIALTFGKDCEVVIHDLSDPQHSVVYVANNSVTGRMVGESFHQLITDVIFSEALQEGYVANYYFETPGGKLIRSSTLLLYDEDHELTGALCINLDTTQIKKAADALQEFLPQANAAEGKQAMGSQFAYDTENSDVKQMVKSLVDNIMGGDRSETMTREERLEKIRFMDERGIFLMKGAVDLVANKLGVNRVTVYGYLDEIRGKRQK